MTFYFFFFFQAEDGIRDIGVTGVQTCALPIFPLKVVPGALDAVPEDLTAGVAVAVDLAAALDLEQIDPASAREVEPQGLEPDPLPLRYPGQLVAVDGHVGQPHRRDYLLRPFLRQGPLLSLACL